MLERAQEDAYQAKDKANQMLLTDSYRDLSIEKIQTNRSVNNLSSLQIQDGSGDTGTVNKTNIEIVSQ